MAKSKLFLIFLHVLSLPTILDPIKGARTKSTITCLHAIVLMVTGCCVENRLDLAKSGSQGTS